MKELIILTFLIINIMSYKFIIKFNFTSAQDTQFLKEEVHL